MGRIVGVIAGLVVLFVIVVAVQLFGPLLHPIPAGIDPKAAMATWIETAPASVHVLIILAWLLAALGGGWVALRISGWLPALGIVVALDMVMALSTVLRFQHPWWMTAAAVAAPLLGGYLAMRLGSRRAAGPING